MQETWVRSLGREDHLEKEMATHSSHLAWEIPWTKEPGGLQYMGSQRVGHDWVTDNNLTLACKGSAWSDSCQYLQPPHSLPSCFVDHHISSCSSLKMLLFSCPRACSLLFPQPRSNAFTLCTWFTPPPLDLNYRLPSTPTLYHKVGQPLPTPFFFKKIIYLFDYFRSLLRHSGSSFLLSSSVVLWPVGSQFPNQGLNLCPMHCKVDS